MALTERSVDLVAEVIKNASDDGEKTALLIGAGVSLSGGIGLAADFIARIKEKFPVHYNEVNSQCGDGQKPSYAQCMAALPPAQQVSLVREDIDKAKINWAHVGIARIERDEIVDTILTPNFDPLASRACALFNRFPAVYDLAGLRSEADSQISFDRSFVKGNAIFHLHGQHTGFRLLNTDDKLEEQAARIKPILDAVAKGKPLIIAGYSGANDPLVKRIAELAPFNHGLFWVCHDDQDPARYVIDNLLSKENCFVVRNRPADRFFTELANALGTKPPGLLSNPFDHMLDILNTLHDDPEQIEPGNDKLLREARRKLEDASSEEDEDNPEYSELATLMGAGEYEEVWDKFGSDTSDRGDAEQDLIAWAAIMLGNNLSDQANTKDGEEADRLFEQAGKKYAAALDIKSDKHEALSNWGVALSEQAKTKNGDEMDHLFERAGEKLVAAESVCAGSASYNLSCLCALRADAEAAAHWLRSGHHNDSDFPACGFIAEDSDFDGIRETEEFQTALRDIGC